MHPSRRLLPRALLGAIAFAVVLSGCAKSQTAANTAATVAGTDITTDQLARTAAVFTTVAAMSKQTCGQTDGPTDTQTAACNRTSLSTLIAFHLAESYAQANGLTVTDADVAKNLAAFQSSAGADVLATQLAANNATIDDVRELIRLSLVKDAVQAAIAAQRLDDAQLRARYQSSIADYSTLHVDHILVDSQAKAQAVYDQVSAPGTTLAEFQALAKQVSTDPNAAQDGGELTLLAGQLVPEFATAALALQPGEISPPVQTQYGWHVIWMIDQHVTPFAKARDKILTNAQPEEFAAWVREQNAAGQITVDPSFGRFDDQQLAVVRITSTDPSATQAPASGAVNGTSASP